MIRSDFRKEQGRPDRDDLTSRTLPIAVETSGEPYSWVIEDYNDAVQLAVWAEDTGNVTVMRLAAEKIRQSGKDTQLVNTLETSAAKEEAAVRRDMGLPVPSEKILEAVAACRLAGMADEDIVSMVALGVQKA